MSEYPSSYPPGPSSSVPPPVTSAPPITGYPPAPGYAAAPMPAPMAMAMSMPMAAPVADARARNLAIGLFGCALVILVGVVTKEWFTAGHGAGHVGLTGLEACRGGMCQTLGWGQLNHVGKDIELFGWLGFLSGLAAVAVTIAIAVLTLQGKAAKIPNRPFAVVLGIAAFSTTMFFMRVIGDQKDLSPSWSGFAAVGGLIAVSVLLKKVAPKA